MKYYYSFIYSILLIILLIFVIIIPGAIYADRITLKSGIIIEGEIIERNDRFLTFDPHSDFDITNINDHEYQVQSSNLSDKESDPKKYIRVESRNIVSVQLAYRGFPLCYQTLSSAENNCGYILIRWNLDRIIVASLLNPYKSISIKLNDLRSSEVYINKNYLINRYISEKIKLSVILKTNEEIKGELKEIFDEFLILQLDSGLEQKVTVHEIVKLKYNNQDIVQITQSPNILDNQKYKKSLYDYLVPGLHQFNSKDSFDRYYYLAALSTTLTGIVSEYINSRNELKKQKSNIIPVRVNDNYILLDYSNYSKFENHKRNSNYLFLGLATLYIFNFQYVYNYDKDINIQIGVNFNPMINVNYRNLNEFNIYELMLTVKF